MLYKYFNKLTQEQVTLIKEGNAHPDTLTAHLKVAAELSHTGQISVLDQGTLECCVKSRAASSMRGTIAHVRGKDKTTPDEVKGLVASWQKYVDMNMLQVKDASIMKKEIQSIIDASRHRGIAFRV